MALIRIGGFQGERPRVHPRLLPDSAAQVALNCRIDTGALGPIKDTSNVQPTTLTNPISLYRYSDSVWLEATSDTDWVPYPVANDIYGRVIFADPDAGELRVTDASLVGAGGYPAGYRRLDVPAPTQGFSATLQGTADDADEVPETRYYVCTFVNSWGAEGPPSPPSNQVEWRSGQSVLLEGLPSVPTGSYDIVYRRIYRLNTGSTGTTNYQFVTEISVASSTRSVSAITQTNPIVVTTSSAHGLSNGQEVLFTGLGLGTAVPLVTPGVSKLNPATVHATGHGVTNGQTVLLTGMTGMTELEDTRNVSAYVNNDTLSLPGVDATAYTDWVSGGTVTPVYGMDELNNNSYFIEVIDDTSFSLIGIDGTGYYPYVEAGTVGQVTGVTYTDSVPSESLAEVLPTELYDPPNDNTIGIKAHPAGFLAGFFGNTLALSEPGAPHAWPIDYRFVTGHDIVGLGVFGNTIAVVTKGWPYLAVGSDPAAMSMIELEIEQACASKRGIVDFGTAIAYPSPDGLIVLSGSGATNSASGIFTRDQWQELVPSSFVAYNWEQQYLCFYDNGAGTQRGFIIDPFDPDAGVRYVAKVATGGHKDLEEDILYLIISDEIEKWDQGTSLRYTWKSKPTYTPHAINMSAAKIIADAYPVEVTFYVDDVNRYSRNVSSSAAFRLPGGFRGEKFEVVLKSTKQVSEVALATTMLELAITV